MAPNSRWGLIGRCQELVREVFVLPMDSVNVQVSVRGFVAKVSVCQVFHNVTNHALEVEYSIPVDEGAAVYKLEAVVDGRKINAQIMEKKKAEEIYKEAVKSQKTAVLAREDSLSSDIFNLALGNLPPGKKVELQLSMVMELKVQTDGAVNFTLPTVLNPRYCPDDVTPDQHTKSVKQLYGPEVVIVAESYEFSIQAKVHGGHKISRIISNKDALDVNISDDAMSAEVGMRGGFTPNHDWNMLLYYYNPYKSHIIRETGDRSSTGLMKDDLIMVNLHPEIPQENYSNKNEVIFVVDRSGSMGGERIQSAKATLLFFLKSLPIGCYFNVISFGSRFSFLFEKGSEIYTETTLQKACNLQQEMKADMGGTEILKPLKEIYKIPPKSGYARQIILLTDGEVSNVDKVKELVSQHAYETRVFTVGIGDGASTALIKGVANAGRGRSEMVYRQDKLQLKVMGLVKSMLQETVQEVTVNVEVDPPCGIKLVPKVPPIIFGGQHLILYTRVPSATTVKNVTIKGVVGEKQLSVGVEGSNIVTIHDEEMTLHRLAARSQINQWQIDDEDDVAEDMITMSLASGVVSRLTALVGVDEDMSPVIGPQDPTGGVESDSAYVAYGGVCCDGGSMRQAASSFGVQSDGGRGAVSSDFAAFAPYASMSKMAPTNYEVEGKKHRKKESDFTLDKNAKPEEILMAVVKQQKFDGSWTLTDAVKLTFLPLKRLHDANISKNEVAWATALVLALLEKKFSSEEDEWVLLAHKARSYIQSCGEDVNTLLTSARLIITEK